MAVGIHSFIKLGLPTIPLALSLILLLPGSYSVSFGLSGGNLGSQALLSLLIHSSTLGSVTGVLISLRSAFGSYISCLFHKFYFSASECLLVSFLGCSHIFSFLGIFRIVILASASGHSQVKFLLIFWYWVFEWAMFMFLYKPYDPLN